MNGEGPLGIDAYRPAEIAAKVEAAGVVKARLPVVQMLTLAVLAGAFIALGGAAYTQAMTGAVPGVGAYRVLGGMVFSLGLILVIVGGAELFTGNALMVMAAVDGRISLAEMLRAWGIVYVGNLLGALGLAALIAPTGLLDGPMGEVARGIAAAKLTLSPAEAFFRGVLCNMLVCLAVWLTLAARTVTGKVLAILWPITAFVALGFEHSVANMYLLPQGALAGAAVPLGAAAANLFWVTLGNILGGAGGVAAAYRLAYGPAV